MIFKIFKLIRYFLLTLFILASAYAINFYEGSTLIFIIYCLSFILMFFYLTNEKSTYFEIIFSFYLFMGFWSKYIYSLIWRSGKVIESGQKFSNNIDQILLIGIFIALVCLFASYVNKQIIKIKVLIYEKNIKKSFFETCYLDNKLFILLVFGLSFSAIGFLNIRLGIYQRGFINSHQIDPIISNLIKWLLMFGFTTFSCFMIHTEILYRKKIGSSLILLAIIELFISYTSILSRMFVINVTFLLLPISKEIIRLKNNINKFFVIFPLVILFLSAFSLYIVNEVRLNKMKLVSTEVNLKKLSTIEDPKKALEIIVELDSDWISPDSPERLNPDNFAKFKKEYAKKEKAKKMGLFIPEKHKSINVITDVVFKRWIGLDSLIAVYNFEGKSFKFLIKALDEKKTNTLSTFYEKIFNLKKLIIKTDLVTMKGNSLPGIISFLYYSGNLYFVLFVLFLLVVFFSNVERFIIKVTNNNLIFCCFISNLIASRLINFGYAPKDSYLFLISILLSILMMIFLQKASNINTYKK